jgi:hypothetical protein
MQVLVKAKSLWSSKTFWFNVLSGALEVAQILLDFRVIEADKILMGMAVGNVILRYVTKQPVTVTPGVQAMAVDAPEPRTL